MTAQTADARRFLTRHEFMAELRISETTYHQLAKRGLVRPLRIGRNVLIPIAEVEATLARLNPAMAA